MVRNKITRQKAKKPVVICICGMAGSGKSTVGKKLAQKYGLAYFSGGNALKARAIEQGYKSSDLGWWESEEGMRFLRDREQDHTFDRLVDRKLLEIAEKGNVVIDSWTMPWLLKKSFKIWLDASASRRAARIAKRDRMSVEDASKALESKEMRTKNIYKKLYGFDLGEDFAPFHLILDTDSLNAGEVFHVLCAVINNVVLDSGNACA
jgi:cytidylate kinase